MLDTEAPREESSISNRVVLAQSLHLEKLMKKNKEHPKPLKAMIEVMVKYFLEKSAMPFRPAPEEPPMPDLEPVKQKRDAPVPWAENEAMNESRGSKKNLSKLKSVSKAPQSESRGRSFVKQQAGGKEKEDISIEDAFGGEQIASQGFSFKCLPKKPSDDDGIIHRTLFLDESSNVPEPRRYRGVSPEDPKFRQRPAEGQARAPPATAAPQIQRLDSTSATPSHLIAAEEARDSKGSEAFLRPGAVGPKTIGAAKPTPRLKQHTKADASRNVHRAINKSANNSVEMSAASSALDVDDDDDGTKSFLAAKIDAKSIPDSITTRDAKSVPASDITANSVTMRTTQPSGKNGAAGRPSCGGRPTSSRPTSSRASSSRPLSSLSSSSSSTPTTALLSSAAAASAASVTSGFVSAADSSSSRTSAPKLPSDESSRFSNPSPSGTMGGAATKKLFQKTVAPMACAKTPNDDSSRDSESREGESREEASRDDELVDVEDEELDDVDRAALAAPRRFLATPLARNVTPIDEAVARNLKAIIFGPVRSAPPKPNAFPDEWRLQAFTFHERLGIQYGIIQLRGGPCGVLAALQAALLREMLFGEDEGWKKGWRGFQATASDPSARLDRLARALAWILWRAGEERGAIVAAPTSSGHFHHAPGFVNDGLTETLNLHEFDDPVNLFNFLRTFCETNLVINGYPSVVVLLYSAVLSRGIDKVRADFDDPNSQLMGQHSYCSLEMVNLLLSGAAVSNVHNHVVELGDPTTEDCLQLKGLVKQNAIGLLSLFEHYRSCEVGTFYKTPQCPIWVVCSESHFSVLFCLNRELVSNWKAERRFDLYYFDGLANQEAEIRLTIDTTNGHFRPEDERELVPPIDHVIRTKWKGAAIYWNGSEPFL